MNRKKVFKKKRSQLTCFTSCVKKELMNNVIFILNSAKYKKVSIFLIIFFTVSGRIIIYLSTGLWRR